MNTAREQALIQTRRTREDAEKLLTSLLEAQAGCDAQLAAENRSDLVRKVKGRTSLEEAIEQTRRMIEVLKRAEDESASDAATSNSASSSDTSEPGPAGRVSADAATLETGSGTPHAPVAPTLAGLISEFKSRGLNLPGLDDARTPSPTTEEEATVAGVLRPAASSPRSKVFFGSRTSTRWGAAR